LAFDALTKLVPIVALCVVMCQVRCKVLVHVPVPARARTLAKEVGVVYGRGVVAIMARFSPSCRREVHPSAGSRALHARSHAPLKYTRTGMAMQCWLRECFEISSHQSPSNDGLLLAWLEG